MDDEYKLKLKKLKKNSFQLFDSDSKLINFNLENCYLKFGIENYNDKKILNIFIKKENTNENYNKIVSIINIVNKIKNLNKNDIANRKYDICEKGFQSPLKEITEFDKDILVIRTYLDYKCNISVKDILGNLSLDEDLSKKYANINIIIKNMWTTDNNYGIVIYTNNIELLI